MTMPPRVVPAETELTEPYWAAAREGVIAVQQCSSCEHMWHPPAPVCPRCRTASFRWVRTAGTGRLYSYTRVEHAAHPAVAGALPYSVALIELDEGPRVLCGLLDDTGPTLGQQVTIELGRAAGGLDLPMARPVRDGRDATGPGPRA